MSEEYASEDEYAIVEDSETNFTVDDLYRREAEVTTNLLVETIENLYTPAELPPVDEVVDEFARPPTYGYAAHVDKVSFNEVSNWQRAFSYLAVTGTAIHIPDFRSYSCENCSGVKDEIFAQEGNLMAYIGSAVESSVTTAGDGIIAD